MTEDFINFDYITRYIRRTLKKSEGLLLEMEEFAKENEVPISQPESIKLNELLIKIGNVKKVLEIGTAIGYSAIRMVLSGKITVFDGDAKDILPTLNGEYDLVFIDAAKGQYNEFFKQGMRLLKKGGILVSDNILYKGMTATDELLQHRKITIVKRLREYVDMLCNHPKLDTDILPLGDGVAISVKCEEGE